MNRWQELRNQRAIVFPTDMANIAGMLYPLFGQNQTLGKTIEDIDLGYESFVWRCYMSNPIVYACIMKRMMLFTEARFGFQNMRGGVAGDFYGDRDRPDSGLALLDHPWPGGTTGDLLKYMILDADLAGNAFITRRKDRLVRLRPDWTQIIHTSPDRDATMWDPRSELAGYAYQPGGPAGGQDWIYFGPEDVAHFAPIPDPLLPSRGMTWLSPILREIKGDQAASEHKLMYWEHGATANLYLRTQIADPEKLQKFMATFRQNHEGTRNAYKMVGLTQGIDPVVIGSDLRQQDFKAVIGSGETRIAAAAGVPAAVLGISEGLAGSALNAGNFGQAMRNFADLTMRPNWRNAAGSLERIVPPPSGARLWYDDRDIPALKDDIMSAAQAQSTQASTIAALFAAGWDADAAVDAVIAGDLKRLKGKHTDVQSVQVQPAPGAAANGTAPVEPAAASTNGNGKARSLELKEYLRAGEPDYLFVRHLEGQHDQLSHGHGSLGYTGLAEAAKEGGFSVTTHGDVPQGGFMVSPYGRAEAKYDARSMTRDDVRRYRESHAKLLAKPDHYLGGWRDGDTVYLDVAVHTDTAAEAEAISKEHNQLAYFDLAKGDSVYLEGAPV